MRLLANLAVIVAVCFGAGACASSANNPDLEEEAQEPSAVTHLMFTGKAEEAVRFYVETVPNSSILSMEYFGPEEGGTEGQVKLARFRLGGTTFQAFDSPPVHAFTFTSSTSIFVTCETEQELRSMAAALSVDGSFQMPLDDYGFSRLFCWLTDRWGVAWQLNLPHGEEEKRAPTGGKAGM